MLVHTFTFIFSDFFHQTIMMSGSDMSSFAWVNPYWQPRQYAQQLGAILNCDAEDMYVMIECLRDNITRPWQLFVEAQAQVKPKVKYMTFLLSDSLCYCVCVLIYVCTLKNCYFYLNHLEVESVHVYLYVLTQTIVQRA